MSALDKRQGQAQRQATRNASGGGGGGNTKKRTRRDHGGGGGGGHHHGHHGGGGGGGGKKDVTKTPDKIDVPKLPFAPGGKPLGLNLPNQGTIGNVPAYMGYASLPAYSAPAAPSAMQRASTTGATGQPYTPGVGQSFAPASPSVLNTAGQSNNPFSLQAAANSAGGMNTPTPKAATPKPIAPVSDPYAKTAAPKANPLTGGNPLTKAATAPNPLAAAATRTPNAPAAPGQPYGPPPTGGTLAQQYQGTTPTPGGGGGNPYGGGTGPIFSDKNDYEYQQFTDKPEEAYHALAQTAGINTEGSDTLGKWLKDQYQKMQMDYNALRTESDNRDLSWFDFLGNLGGTPYGQPGWDAAFKKYLVGRYNNDSLANRGLNYSPYEGQSRWLALG